MADYILETINAVVDVAKADDQTSATVLFDDTPEIAKTIAAITPLLTKKGFEVETRSYISLTVMKEDDLLLPQRKASIEVVVSW